MRVAAYTGGVMVPSARARVRQYIGPLGQLGIAVREYPLPWGNILPRQLALRPLWMAATAAARTAALTCSWKADVTWISRQLLPAFAPLQAMAKRPMILDVDDAVWLNTGGHRARDLARASDLVVCGNSFLADQFSRWNTNVTVIPTAVNTYWYRPAPGSRRRPCPHWSWAGPAPAATFLSSTRSREHCCGYCSTAARPSCSSSPIGRRNSNRLPESRVEFELWTPRTELAAFARMSIGLMPLADTDWCNGKCSYKMLCYMAAGLACGRDRRGNESRGTGDGRGGLERRQRAGVGRCTHRTARATRTCASAWAPPAALWSRSALACSGWRNNMRLYFSPWAETLPPGSLRAPKPSSRTR